jgi:hypothetical protein
MPSRWSIRVTFADGNEALLRHGPVVGEGDVVTFRTRKLAEINADLVRNGLEEGDVVTIIPAARTEGR